MKTSMRIVVLSTMVIFFCSFMFQFPAMASISIAYDSGQLPGYYTPYGEPNTFQYNPDVGPAYLYKFKEGRWELYAMPVLPPSFEDAQLREMVSYYEIHQVRNGKVTMRLRYNDGAYSTDYDNFSIDANMDGGLLQPKLLNLEYKNGAPYRLANNNLVARSETGRYHIYSPDGSSEAVKLNFNYGNKLELAAYYDYLPSVLNDPTFDDDFYTYVGVGLEYLPETEQYVLLYCLSPFYGTDGSEAAYWQKNHPDFSTPLNVAIFDSVGNRQATFKLPDVSVYGSIYGDVHIRNNPDVLSQFQSTIVYHVYVSDQTRKILVEIGSIKNSKSKYAMIDLEKQDARAATEQDIRLFFPNYQNETYNTEVTMSTPYKIEYRSDGTYLLSNDGGKVLRYFQGPYLLAYLTKDIDGTYYAFFACNLESEDHPANSK